MSHILIVGAMQEEVEAIQEWLQGEKKEIERYIALPYWHGSIGSHTIYLVQSGIGKVAAAASLIPFLTQFPIDYILNIGSAGGLNDTQEIGDIVIADKTLYHDADVRGFGYELGQLPQMPHYFECDTFLNEKAKVAAESLKIKYHSGLIISGDSFINEKEKINRLKESFPSAIGVEMEASAVGQVAYLYHKPYLIVRAISDKANAEATLDFPSFLKIASQNSSQLVKKIVESIQ